MKYENMIKIISKFEGSNIVETINDLEYQRDIIYLGKENIKFNRVLNAMKRYKKEHPNNEFF